MHIIDEGKEQGHPLNYQKTNQERQDIELLHVAARQTLEMTCSCLGFTALRPAFSSSLPFRPLMVNYRLPNEKLRFSREFIPS
jgi:hypothetical protein